MESLGKKDVVAIATPGLVALFGKQIFLRIVSFVSAVFLARLLTPEVFGVYAISLFFMCAMGALSDIGFGLGLLRNQKEPSTEELQVYFSFQFLVVGTITTFLVLYAKSIGAYFGMPAQDIWAFDMFVLITFLSILGTPSQIILQRKLAFGVVARIQAVNDVVHHLIAVASALYGLGIGSFVLASLGKVLIGILQNLLAAPFSFRLNMKFSLLKPYLGFGLAGQGTYLIQVLQKNMGSALVGSMNGAGAAGYFNWAMSYTLLPNSFAEALKTACFSTFSRLQQNKVELEGFFAKIIRVFFLFGAPLTISLVFWAPEIIAIIYSSKWLLALPAVYALVGCSLLRFIVDPFVELFLAMGLSREILKFHIFCVIITMAAAIPLIQSYGFMGMGWALSFGVSVMLILVLYKIVRICNGKKLFLKMRAPIFSGVVMLVFLFGISEDLSPDYWSKGVISVFSFFVFVGTLWLIDSGEIKREVKDGFVVLKRFRYLTF